jgi:hypothetical protein
MSVALPFIGMASGAAVTRNAYDVGHSRIGSHAGARCTDANTENRLPDSLSGRLRGDEHRGATRACPGTIAAVIASEAFL